MSQPPSRSPDSLTGASPEISALQLVEGRGDGVTEGERGMGRRGGVKGRDGGEEGKVRRGGLREWEEEEKEGKDVGERKEMKRERKPEEGEERKERRDSL